MKLDIEVWMQNKDFSNDVVELFEESFRCYKSSAYKASLLFSFLGFQTIIKERILKSDKPSHLNINNWNAIHKKLRDDDDWDKEVIESIKKSDVNKKIFDINDDIRQQALYWKNRRNDCAHSKRNTITDVHVEAFWFFLKSNLAHFVIPGSLNALIKKIQLHFDTDYTPIDKPLTELLSDTQQIVDEKNAPEFLAKIIEVFKEEAGPFWPIINGREFEFFEKLITSNQTLDAMLIDVIADDEELYIEFISDRPSRIQYFLKHEQLIRKTWRRMLLKGQSTLPLLSAILRFVDVPKEELDDIFFRIIKNGFDLRISKVDMEMLTDHGFFDKLREVVFIGNDSTSRLINDFVWGNKNANIAAFYLKTFEIDFEIVESLTHIFSSSPYPFKAQELLKEFFSRENAIKQKFIEVANSKVTLPSSLGFEE